MGGIVIVESTSGGSTTDGANKDLSNLTVTGENKFKASALKSSDANNGISEGSDSKLFINVTGKADTDLSNLSATGEARFTAKAGVDLDNISSAGVAVIQSYATGAGANTDLSNLTTTGENKFKASALKSSDANNGLSSGSDSKLFINITGKANVSLDNINSAGNTVIKTQAKLVCMPYPTITSDAVGKSYTIYSDVGSALVLPAGGTWFVMSIVARDESTTALTMPSVNGNTIIAGGTTLLNAASGVRGIATIIKIA